MVDHIKQFVTAKHNSKHNIETETISTLTTQNNVDSPTSTSYSISLNALDLISLDLISSVIN